MKKENCPNCGEEIDPETCWCGCEKYNHGYSENHFFVPLDCKCFYSNSSISELLDVDLSD
jgi:hypothetical protein